MYLVGEPGFIAIVRAGSGGVLFLFMDMVYLMNYSAARIIIIIKKKQLDCSKPSSASAGNYPTNPKDCFFIENIRQF